jgi:redox-sensitive bicupin YhaK (pirin superfamily)
MLTRMVRIYTIAVRNSLIVHKMKIYFFSVFFVVSYDLFVDGMSTTLRKSSILLKSIPWSLSAEEKSVVTVQKNLKLPVWPIWGGILAQIAEWSGLKPLSDSILASVGGRVVPISLGENLSPFILLVHHAHSFTSFDPFRSLTKLLLPEGFPAHPHAGFDTVTYCLEGGLRHRDSEAFRMVYGDGEVQWMRSGRGIMHEEMWNIPYDCIGHHRIELFQLWVNVPQSEKQSEPATHRLYSSDMPVLSFLDNQARVKVISGSFADCAASPVSGPGDAVAASAVGIFHLSCAPDQDMQLHIGNVQSAALYVRKGSVALPDSESRIAESGDLILITAAAESASSNSRGQEQSKGCTMRLSAGARGLDGLLVTGQDLAEPVLSRGSFVQADKRRLQLAESIFGSLGAGAYWDHRVGDQEWRQHCDRLQLQKIISAAYDRFQRQSTE